MGSDTLPLFSNSIRLLTVRASSAGGWWNKGLALQAHGQGPHSPHNPPPPPPPKAAHANSSSLLDTIPKLGLSTFLTPPGEATRGAVSHALSEGYRHIDTSELFKNEKDVGAALQGSGLSRDEVFITTRFWHHAGGGDPLPACRASLRRLGVSSVDAYLLYPVKGETLMLRVWEAMQELQRTGLATHLGLSLATPSDIEAIARAGLPLPRLVQAPVCPFSPQRDLRSLCADHGIHLSSLSPLGGGLNLDNATVGSIARARGATPGQVLIAWGLKKGFSCVPKSSSPRHIAENYGALGLDLSDEDMARLDAIRPPPFRREVP